MMELGSLFPRASKKTRLIVDVESGSVGIGVLSLSATGPATIHAASRSSFSLEEKTKEQLLTDISSGIASTAEVMLKEYASKDTLPHPEQGYVFFRAPWARTFGARVSGTFPTERGVEDDMVRSLAREALKHMQGLELSRLFESSVVRVDLNGYPTRRPTGKRSKSVGVTVLASDADDLARGAVSEALGRAFPGRLWKERSGARALVALIEERTVDTRDYFVVDVGSDYTDITAIRKNEVTEHSMVPEGLRSILRRITPKDGLPEERLALLKMVATDVCSGEACDELRASLGKAEGDLARIFGEAFGKIAGIRRVPNMLMLSAHQSLMPWLETFFTRVDFGQFTRTTEPFTVTTLSPERLTPCAVFDEGVAPDTGLALAAGFVNTQEGRRR